MCTGVCPNITISGSARVQARAIIRYIPHALIVFLCVGRVDCDSFCCIDMSIVFTQGVGRASAMRHTIVIYLLLLCAYTALALDGLPHFIKRYTALSYDTVSSRTRRDTTDERRFIGVYTRVDESSLHVSQSSTRTIVTSDSCYDQPRTQCLPPASIRTTTAIQWPICTRAKWRVTTAATCMAPYSMASSTDTYI